MCCLRFFAQHNSGCYFEDGGDLKLDMSVEDAYKRSIHTFLNWVRQKVNTTQTHVIFRTYSPVHFRSVGRRNLHFFSQRVFHFFHRNLIALKHPRF